MADKRKIIREKAKVFFLRLGKCPLRPFSIRKCQEVKEDDPKI